jgi:phosphoglycerate dehydrogenase-like enzyme
MTARRLVTIHACVGDHPRARAEVEAASAQAGRTVVHVASAELPARLPEIEVLLCGVAPRIDWSAAARLRLLQLMGSGTDALWPATGLPAHVAVANARGIHLPEMRDHALALILAFARELPRLLDQQQRRLWQPLAAGAVAGRTAGILGLGEVGRSVAAGCAALGMRVIGTRAGAAAVPGVQEVHPPEALDRVLAASDYVVVTLPLTPRTRGLLGREALARLRPHAVLIHLSRGGIVDEVALGDALAAGRLRGAALDVFAQEPLPAESPLWDTPNLIVTPHVAGLTADYVQRALALFLENLALVERGLPPRTQVDAHRGY